MAGYHCWGTTVWKPLFGYKETTVRVTETSVTVTVVTVVRVVARKWYSGKETSKTVNSDTVWPTVS